MTHDPTPDPRVDPSTPAQDRTAWIGLTDGRRGLWYADGAPDPVDADLVVVRSGPVFEEVRARTLEAAGRLAHLRRRIVGDHPRDAEAVVLTVPESRRAPTSSGADPHAPFRRK